MLKKLYPAIHKFIMENDNLMATKTNIQRHEIVPINGRIKLVKEVSSRDIRLSIANPPIPTYKLLNDHHPDKIKALGRKLMRLTNTKLKMILLRSIHGDIYSGTRLKKFGMTDCDKCPRCDRPETIEHQLLSCYYCRTLWSAVSDLTGIRTSNMDSLLGLDDTHDTVTITIHSEIIRKLLAIERPTCNPIELLRSTLNNLALLEKGVTRYQINILQRQLDITYTQGLT